MFRPNRRAISVLELLIVMTIIAVVVSLTLGALRSGSRSVENLKIAQFVRGGVGRCADLKVKRMPRDVFYVTWRGEENQPRMAFLTLDANGGFTYLPPPWPPPPIR